MSCESAAPLIVADCSHHEVAVLGHALACCVDQANVGGNGDDLSVVLGDDDLTVLVDRIWIRSPSQKSGHDLFDLAEPRCGGVAEVEGLESVTVPIGRVPQFHEGAGSIGETDPLGAQVLVVGRAAARRRWPLARLRVGVAEDSSASERR